jgi:hypothetical protein
VNTSLHACHVPRQLLPHEITDLAGVVLAAHWLVIGIESPRQAVACVLRPPRVSTPRPMLFEETEQCICKTTVGTLTVETVLKLGEHRAVRHTLDGLPAQHRMAPHSVAWYGIQSTTTQLSAAAAVAAAFLQ